jgi:oligopeptidase A
MNPLLSRDFLIPFDAIRADHVIPGIREALARAEDELHALVTEEGERTYSNTIQRLDDLLERLSRVVEPASHLVSVVTTPELREAYNTILPEFSSFFAKLPLDDRLWQAIKGFAESEEAKALTGVRKRHLEKVMRSFVRAGADLPPEQKARMEEIQVELSRLHNEFADATLDATNAFELVITDSADLAGLPESAILQARANAEAKGVEGWRFTLQLPSYGPFMQYAENRELRRTMYEAYFSRASSG